LKERNRLPHKAQRCKSERLPVISVVRRLMRKRNRTPEEKKGVDSVLLATMLVCLVAHFIGIPWWYPAASIFAVAMIAAVLQRYL